MVPLSKANTTSCSTPFCTKKLAPIFPRKFTFGPTGEIICSVGGTNATGGIVVSGTNIVNETIDEVKKIEKLTGIDFVQIHGDEDIEYCYNFDLEEVIKVLRIGKKDILLDEVLNSDLKYVLFDKYSNQKYGGTGESINWNIVSNFKEKFKGKIFLSAGLNINNVKKAVEELGIQAEVVKVEDLQDIINRGVMMTPAVVVDGEVKISCHQPTVEEIKKIIKK